MAGRYGIDGALPQNFNRQILVQQGANFRFGSIKGFFSTMANRGFSATDLLMYNSYRVAINLLFPRTPFGHKSKTLVPNAKNILMATFNKPEEALPGFLKDVAQFLEKSTKADHRNRAALIRQFAQDPVNFPHLLPVPPSRTLPIAISASDMIRPLPRNLNKTPSESSLISEDDIQATPSNESRKTDPFFMDMFGPSPTGSPTELSSPPSTPIVSEYSPTVENQFDKYLRERALRN